MKYLGNFHNNFSSAVGSQDKSLQQDILLDKYSELIKQYPTQVAHALQKADVHLSSNPSTVELIDKVAYNVHHNPEFQRNISVLVTKYTEKDISPNFSSTYYFKMMGNSYSSSNGETAGAVAGSTGGGGGDAAGIVTAVAGLTSSIFDYSAANKGLEASEADARAAMYEKIFGKSQSRSWVLPTVIIGGVLLIGGLVVFLTLRKKR